MKSEFGALTPINESAAKVQIRPGAIVPSLGYFKSQLSILLTTTCVAGTVPPKVQQFKSMPHVLLTNKNLRLKNLHYFSQENAIYTLCWNTIVMYLIRVYTGISIP